MIIIVIVGDTGSTDISCNGTTLSLSAFVGVLDRTSSTLVDLFVACTDLDTQETNVVSFWMRRGGGQEGHAPPPPNLLKWRPAPPSPPPPTLAQLIHNV